MKKPASVILILLTASSLVFSNINDYLTEAELERLAYLEQYPVDLNTASRRQLQQVVFLPAEAVTHIIEARQKLLFDDVYDLVKRRIVDETLFTEIRPYVQVRAAKRKGILDVLSGMQNAEILYDLLPLDEGYYGNAVGYAYRGYFEFVEHFGVGGIVHKDVGEPDYFDLVKGNIYFKDLAFLHNAIIGSHHISWGEGLLLNTKFPPIKSALSIQGIRNHRDSARPDIAKGENYLNGAYLELKFGPVHLAGFWDYYNYSSTKYTEEGTVYVKSLAEGGYNRTANELSKKNNHYERMAGGRIKFETAVFSWGGSFVHSQFDWPVIPDVERNKYYAFRGQNLMGASTDMALAFGNHEIFTEIGTAIYPTIDEPRFMAVNTINDSTYAMSIPSGYLGWEFKSKRAKAIAQGRYFSRDFYTLHANRMEEKSRVEEAGLYSGGEYKFSKLFHAGAFLDLFYFPYRTWDVGSGSGGYDTSIFVKLVATPRMYFMFNPKFADKPDTVDDELVRAKKLTAALSAVFSEKVLSANVTTKYITQMMPSSATGWINSLRLKIMLFELIDIYYGYAYYDIYGSVMTAIYENDTPFNFSIVSITKSGQGHFAMLRIGKRWLSMYVKYSVHFSKETNEKRREILSGALSSKF